MKRREMFVRILVIIAGVEVVVMFLLGALELPEGNAKNFIDAFTLSVLSAPLLYYSVIRPVTHRLSEQSALARKALEQELALKAYAEKLELKEAADAQSRLQAQRMELLGKFHAGAIEEADLDVILSDTAKDICRVLDVPCCAIRIFGNPDRIAEHCGPGTKPVSSSLALSRIPDACIADFEAGKYKVSDGTNLSPCCSGSDGCPDETGMGAHLEVPLLHSEGLAGILFLGTGGKREWTAEEIATAEAIAGGIAAAVRHDTVFRNQKEMAGRLMSLMNNVPGIVYRGYQDWSVGFMGAEVERVTGYTAEEFTGGSVKWKELMHPDDLPGIKIAFRKAVAERKGVLRVEYRLRHRDGTYRMLADRRQNTYDSKGEFLYVDGLLLDITEVSLLEKQARTAQRMEAVGTLAGGVAHDFNNALTGIFGFGELLRMKLSGDKRAEADLDEMLQCAVRASTLTRQLLTFARRQAIAPVNLSMNSVITDLMKLIENTAGERIVTKFRLEEDLPAVRADRGQLEQVLMNLCLNARDAMPDGGALVVETSAAVLDEEHVYRHPYMKSGRYAVLTVTDTGIGMNESTREKIFEPFFTTKGSDKGTGLGLAMVHGIVKRHEGYIHVYSEPGKGTTFRVHLPAIDGPPEASIARSREVVRGGDETILVADDDDSVRNLAELALGEQGYSVIAARNGEEAVEIFRRGNGIALVLLDVGMPRLDGKEALAVMREMSPGIKAILMSGHDFGENRPSEGSGRNVARLPKPFGCTELAKKVREVLDGN
ncbi:MAG: PAS domain-containing protein [Deltaproteobacteria bacterium]|nr:PAS domain-containing protein [Deltaproteobacteria bacterium]